LGAELAIQVAAIACINFWICNELRISTKPSAEPFVFTPGWLSLVVAPTMDGTIPLCYGLRC